MKGISIAFNIERNDIDGLIIRNENFLSMLFDGKRKKNYGAYGPSFHIEETEEREGRYVYNVIGDFKITNPNGKPYSEKLVDKIVKEL